MLVGLPLVDARVAFGESSGSDGHQRSHRKHIDEPVHGCSYRVARRRLRLVVINNGSFRRLLTTPYRKVFVKCFRTDPGCNKLFRSPRRQEIVTAAAKGEPGTEAKI